MDTDLWYKQFTSLLLSLIEANKHCVIVYQVIKKSSGPKKGSEAEVFNLITYTSFKLPLLFIFVNILENVKTPDRKKRHCKAKKMK